MTRDIYYIGRRVWIVVDVKDKQGNPYDLVDGQDTLAITINGVTQTLAAAEVEKIGTGKYQAPYVPTEGGQVHWRAATTGAVVSAHEGSFHVENTAT